MARVISTWYPSTASPCADANAYILLLPFRSLRFFSRQNDNTFDLPTANNTLYNSTHHNHRNDAESDLLATMRSQLPAAATALLLLTTLLIPLATADEFDCEKIEGRKACSRPRLC